MTTRLEHLRALLDDALNGNPKAKSEFLGRYGERLLDVAEAAEHEPRCPFCAAARNVPGIEREPHLHDCPLATLTEEADHE